VPIDPEIAKKKIKIKINAGSFSVDYSWHFQPRRWKQRPKKLWK